MIRPLRAQTRNANFVEICFIAPTDFIFVRYSVNNNDLPSKYRFYMQGNLVKVNDVIESTYMQYLCTDCLHDLSQQKAQWIRLRPLTERWVVGYE
jgi:hypothetical protein